MAKIIEVLKTASTKLTGASPTTFEYEEPSHDWPAAINLPDTEADNSDADEELPIGAAEQSDAEIDDRWTTNEETSEEIFFIEVGGPDRKIEGSPAVLGSAGNLPQAKSEPQESEPMTLSFRSIETARPSVEFQPWPCSEKDTRHKLAPELVVFHRPDDDISQPYYQILDQVLGNTGHSKVLLFTSHLDGEGTTTTLLNLACAAARTKNLKIVVVDKNWKCPEVAEKLGLPIAPGLQEVLSGSAALETALQKTPVEKLQILALGEITSHESGLWTSEALRWIVRWLCSRHDLVLLDAPAWDNSQEFAALLSICDAAFPVVQESTTTHAQLHQMVQEMTEAGGRICGVIYHHPQKG